MGKQKLTAAQKNELDRRIDLKAKGKAHYSTWDEVKTRIMQRKLNPKAS
ncbi:MAG: addiction module protein [Bacteroidia bacterium]|jgi:putative addiction module component (TIGR02574 family)|nr:addiction module protein [Bacteroidia bacterium]